MVGWVMEGVVGQLGPAVGWMVVELGIVFTFPHVQRSFLRLTFLTKSPIVDIIIITSYLVLFRSVSHTTESNSAGEN